MVLAGGAAMLVLVAVTGLLHEDVRDGLATVAANRREYRLVLACQIPVLALALASLQGARRCFFGSAGRFTQRLQSL